jgi:hypothetical protein
MANHTKPPAPRLLLTETDTCGWLGQAVPGDILEYHRGFLVCDVDARNKRMPERDRAELARVGRRAYWAAEHGLAHLVQRRHGPDDYSYLLIARTRPQTLPVSLSTLLLEPMENE